MIINGNPCDKEGCTRYSDIDLYYEDGSTKEMCADHAWREPNVKAGIPQHGSDNVNVERN